MPETVNGYFLPPPQHGGSATQYNRPQINPAAVFIHEVGSGRMTVKTRLLTLNGNFG
jgi:hypothetical protein